jgi:hypothetical protein
MTRSSRAFWLLLQAARRAISGSAIVSLKKGMNKRSLASSENQASLAI